MSETKSTLRVIGKKRRAIVRVALHNLVDIAMGRARLVGVPINAKVLGTIIDEDDAYIKLAHGSFDEVEPGDNISSLQGARVDYTYGGTVYQETWFQEGS